MMKQAMLYPINGEKMEKNPMFGSATSTNKITACRHMQQKDMVKGQK